MRRITSLMVFSCSVMLATACTSDKIVYRDAQLFAAPPSAALNFVGYSDTATKKTVCGSCHVEKQGLWAQTKHASAWADLQASGGAASYCEACHAVSENGNAATVPSGYSAVKDARYHDVQCENCHGAGLTHVTSPSNSNQPLASIKADTGLKNGCGECHSGVHNPFVDEWRLSKHSVTSTATTSIATDPYCQSCHTAQGALAAWGVNSNYVEKTGPLQDIVCAVCHDPHGGPNSKQLRAPINVATTEGNLCTKCHQRRATSSDATAQGRNSIHSPEGPTLFGTAGWFPPGMSASDSIIGTHGTPSKNPTLCAGCHVTRYTSNDKATGKFVFQSTGHRFKATPCVDANGQPTVSQTCDVTAQTFRSCVSSQCHASESVARSAYTTASARIGVLQTELIRVIGLATAQPAKPCAFPQKTYTTCNGAAFNLSLSQKLGSVIHNPFLIEQLMIASISQMKKDYSITVSADIVLTPLLKKGTMTAGGGH
jgi:predicted CXXCH cytochrome family protein